MSTAQEQEVSPRLTSWSEFQDWIAPFLNGQRHMWRGQPTAKPLRPSLTRLLLECGMDDYDKAHALERDLMRTFFRTAGLHVTQLHVQLVAMSDPERNFLLRWGIMQHYGAPTRLLDWTGSPYVAAYFASVDSPDCDGEIWCYEEKPLEDLIEQAIRHREIPGPPVKFTYEMLTKKPTPTITGWSECKAPLVYHCIHEPQVSRMASQQGVFSVCSDVLRDHCEALIELIGWGRVHHASIAKKCKDELLDRLRYANVTGASLFPDIEGVGRYTREWARLKAFKKRPIEIPGR